MSWWSLGQPAQVTVSSDKYDIQVTGNSPVDVSHITPIVDEAVADFESKVAPLKSKIKISIGASACC